MQRLGNENLRLFFVYLTRCVLHGNNICYRNHDIDVYVISPSKGRVRILFDGKRSEYLEGEVLTRSSHYSDIPVMAVYPGDSYMADPIIVPKHEVEES